MANALKKIITEAKRMRKAKPNSKKQWKTYVKEAAKKVKSGKVKRKPATKKVARKKRKVSSVGKVKKPVYRVTHKVRRVGASGGSNVLPLLILGGICLLGYALFKPKGQVQHVSNGQVLPPLNYTNDVARNTTLDSIVNYAHKIGLAGSALVNFINSLNSSSKDELEDLKQSIDSGAGIPSNWV